MSTATVIDLPTTDTDDSILESVVDAAADLASTTATIEGLAGGYEATYVGFLTKVAVATDQGHTVREIVAAVKAAGVSTPLASIGALSNSSRIVPILNLGGDFHGYVVRPDVSGPLSIGKDEESLASLVKSVVKPEGAKELKAEGIAYGAKVVDSVIAASGTTAEAIKALEALAKSYAEAIKKAGATPPAPKTVDVLLKSAFGPVNKASDVSIAIDDAVACATLVADLEAALALVKAKVDAAS